MSADGNTHESEDGAARDARGAGTEAAVREAESALRDAVTGARAGASTASTSTTASVASAASVARGTGGRAPEPGARAEGAVWAGSESGAGPESGCEAGSGKGTEIEAGLKTEAGAGSRAGSEEAEIEAELKTEARAESGAGSESELGAESESGAEVAGEAGSGADAEAGTGTGTGTGTGAGAEAATGAEAEVEAEGEELDGLAVRDAISAPDAEGKPRRTTRRFPLFTRDTARPEGGGRAASGDAPAPARQWPILTVLSAVALGLLLTALDVFRVGTVLIGAALLAGAAMRWMLPSVGMLAVRSRFTDMLTYGVLGIAIVVLALMAQPNPLLVIPFLDDTLHFTVR